jgi:hypothetical protein
MLTRSVRRAAIAALSCAAIFVPAVALAATAAPSRTASTAAPTVLPACETPGLVIWLNTSGSGAAGSTSYHLEITNLSGQACTLNGYPFLYAVNLAGTQIGHRASFNQPKPVQITINNNKTAHAVLKIVDNLNFPKTTCKPTMAAGLKVFPPNQSRAKIAPFPFGACKSTSVQILSVGPVVNGS